MATTISQDDFQKTALRLPKDLHSMLHEAAQASGRSYNAEIIARLQASFPTKPSISAEDERGAYALIKQEQAYTRDQLERLVGKIEQGLTEIAEAGLKSKRHTAKK